MKSNTTITVTNTIGKAGALLGLGAMLATLGGHAALAAPTVAKTNLEGVTTVLAPSADFDPLKASDQALASYGFPPKPDEKTQPSAFASWKRAVTTKTTRVMPTLEQTNIKHGPYIPATGVKSADTLSNLSYSNNWSGYALYNGVGSYSASSFYFLISDYVVPVAEQAPGQCTNTWDYSSSWIGIDGWGSSDVLQAGTESDAYCASGGASRSTYYAAWYEWYPYGEVRIGGFPVAPGNDMFVEVWSTSATTGHAYLVNYQNNQSINLTFSAPPGTVLKGNSAEWVVERPGIGGGLATLTDYQQDYFASAYAYDFYYHTSQPGAPYAGVASYQIDMLQNGSVVSSPNLLGPNGIWFLY